MLQHGLADVIAVEPAALAGVGGREGRAIGTVEQTFQQGRGLGAGTGGPLAGAFGQDRMHLGIGGMVVLGRTLPAPRTVELLATALTGRVPACNPEEAGWWYPMVERRVRLTDDRTALIAMEEHTDPIAEAVRWSICEGELIQAIGRGRGINRTAATPLEIDLLTDVVLPVTVDVLVPWSDLRPNRCDLMALSGIVLDNAADMAACFPDLWPTREAAKKDGQRKGMYRPEGSGHRTRTACVDIARIPDPEAWLTNRLGSLAQCDIAALTAGQAHGRELIDALGSRLTTSMQFILTARRADLDALSARLEAVTPTTRPISATPNPRQEE